MNNHLLLLLHTFLFSFNYKVFSLHFKNKK